MYPFLGKLVSSLGGSIEFISVSLLLYRNPHCLVRLIHVPCQKFTQTYGSDKCFCGEIRNGKCKFGAPDPNDDYVDIDCDNLKLIRIMKYEFKPRQK